MPVYRDEKTKKYYAKFYYKDWRGQRHQKLKRGFSRSQEAKKYERDFLNELTQGSLITFEHLCQHYLSDNEGRLKPTTQYTSKKHHPELAPARFFRICPSTRLHRL